MNKLPIVSAIGVKLSDKLLGIKLNQYETIVELEIEQDRTFFSSIKFSNITDFFSFCKAVKALEKYEYNRLGQQAPSLEGSIITTDVPGDETKGETT